MNKMNFEESLAHQKHYENNQIQPIEIMKANFTPEEYKGFLQGNVLKYLLRHKYKNGMEDLQKARIYLSWLIEYYTDEKQ